MVRASSEPSALANLSADSPWYTRARTQARWIRLGKSNLETVLLKQLASCLALPMFVLGPDGDLVFFNESAESILGLRFDETGMLGADEWVPLIQTMDETGAPQPGSQRPLIRALTSREPTNGKILIRAFDGQQHRLEGTSLPLVDLDDRLVGALGFFWEIDRQRRPAPALATPTDESTRRQPAVEVILTRRLAEKLALPIFLVDATGRLLYFNAAAEPILGQRFEEFSIRPREALYGTFLPSHLDGRRMKPEEHPLWIARATGEPVHRATRIRGVDNVERVIEVTAIPLVGQSGRVLGACGLFWEEDSGVPVAT